MTTYLLESSLSLLLTFGFYKLVLEKERLPYFKRFYLLSSLLVSALVPFLAIEVEPSLPTLPLPASPAAYVLTQKPVATPPASDPELPVAREEGTNYEHYGLLFYGFVTVVLLLRFSLNSMKLIRQVASHPRQPFRGATLVLLPGSGLPYAFLHYLFVAEAAFRRGEIEEELFTHELAHIRQRHSLDVLLIEVLLCLGWFNPVLYGIRRAMQLNHEFLADEAVNQSHHDTPRYQRLLVSKAADTSLTALTSALTFQTTKQRLQMMTKHTSCIKRWVSLGSTALLFAALVAALGTTTVAQTAPAINPSLPAARQQLGDKSATRPTPILEPEKVIGDKLVKLPDGKRKKYSELSDLEKQWVFYAPLPPRRTPTEAQWTAWHNPKMYGVWVDGKRLRGTALNAYKRTDIVEFSGSYVHKNARQPEGYKYQMSLTTEQDYQKMVKEHEVSPFIVAMPLKLTQHSMSGGEAEVVIQQYGDMPVTVAKGVKKQYSELSSDEKRCVLVLRHTHLARRTPTSAQWAMWGNRKKYAIWIDGKPLHKALTNYQRTNIASFQKNYNREHAKNPNTHMFKITMLTKHAYEEHLKTPLDTVPNLIFIPKLMKYVNPS